MTDFFKLYVPFYMLVFFITAMFLKSYLQYKRTGINPVTFGKKAETAHDYLGACLKVILVLIFCYGILQSFIAFDTISYMDKLLYKVIGIILTIFSLIFILLAQKTMSDSWRIGIDENVKTKLVTNGAFSHVRNPIFLGMIVTLIGLFLLVPTYFMLYLVITSYVLISIQVRLEEEYLAKVHGKEYINYKRKVGRFLPKISK